MSETTTATATGDEIALPPDIIELGRKVEALSKRGQALDKEIDALRVEYLEAGRAFWSAVEALRPDFPYFNKQYLPERDVVLVREKLETPLRAASLPPLRAANN